MWIGFQLNTQFDCCCWSVYFTKFKTLIFNSFQKRNFLLLSRFFSSLSFADKFEGSWNSDFSYWLKDLPSSFSLLRITYWAGDNLLVLGCFFLLGSANRDSSFDPKNKTKRVLQINVPFVFRIVDSLTCRWFPQFYFSLNLNIDRCSACWSRRLLGGWTWRRKL